MFEEDGGLKDREVEGDGLGEGSEEREEMSADFGGGLKITQQGEKSTREFDGETRRDERGEGRTSERLTVIRRPSPIRSASPAAFTLPFLLSTSTRTLSSSSIAGIHASETGESMRRLTSEGGKVMDSTRERSGFSIVCKVYTCERRAS